MSPESLFTKYYLCLPDDLFIFGYAVIVKLDFVDIYDIWARDLWPQRQSKIEQTSAMCYLGGYDLANMSYNPSFFGYMCEGEIAGVNSGHKCADNGYRSRGLYVYPKFRKQGIGTQLLLSTIQQAITENCDFVWSYPKKESFKTYESAGFTLASDWEISELGDNAYCYKKI
jgi:GNAT superfamily N-acetyltransferase